MGRREIKVCDVAVCKRLINGGGEELPRAPKGYVPILVGEGAMVERFHVHVKLLSEPCILVLLDLAADELGYEQEGILRIPCDASQFRQIVSTISKA